MSALSSAFTKETSFAVRTLSKKRILFSSLLALALILISLTIILITEAGRTEGAAVIVTVDGEVIGVYSLSKDGSYELNDGTNTLTVEGGYAYVKKADCPGQDCVNHHKISRSGERIVCTYNRLSIVVEGRDEEIFIN